MEELSDKEFTKIMRQTIKFGAQKSHYYINILTDLTGIPIKEELSTLTTKKRVQEEKEKHEGKM